MIEMSEEKTVMDLAKEFSEVSRGVGKVSYRITYTATPGNTDIHKRFQKFCFEQTNNEYHAGIGKLLDYAAFLNYLMELEGRIADLEDKLSKLTKSDVVDVKEVSGVKTF